MRSIFISSLLLLCLLALSPFRTTACNLSNLTFVSMTGTGPYTITAQLCIGHGRTGSVNGGDNDTRSLFVALYGPGGGPITLSSFSPASVNAPFTGCNMPGISLGAQGSPYNCQASYFFIDPGYYGSAPCVLTPYLCITSTAACGNVSQECVTFTMVTNVIPDSIRVFGAEANGNPVGGCYPNADMMINLVALGLPVTWHEVDAQMIGAGRAEISWSTESETNNDYFVIEKTDRLDDNSYWLSIGEQSGTNTNEYHAYSFIDEKAFEGPSYYRIRQIDFDGKSSYSKVVVLNNTQSSEVQIFPNPAIESVSVHSGNMRSIKLFDAMGRMILEQATDETDQMQLSLQNIPSGMYQLHIEDISGSSSRHHLRIE